ncbi:MAG TPA: cytochrome c oxidase assembly protein [Caulobacteraceae bacterium]|nr:cytochrome c oxidase assembly protein [Caulobacteraceae bacterium]
MNIAFGWEWDPWITAPLALSALLYAVGLGRLWRRAGTGRGVTAWQAAAFGAGWLTLFGALVSPLHELAEHLFVAHMIEHELLMALAPPLLAVSRPLGTFLHALPRALRLWLVAGGKIEPVARLWRFLTGQGVATVLHAVAIWIWHIPRLLDATLQDEGLHRLQHVSFLGTALFFWWAVLKGPRQTFGAGALHVFATMVHTSLLGALITLSPRVLYLAQTVDAPAFGLSPLEDQQLAGLFMWIPGSLAYLAFGLGLAGRWLFAGRGTSRCWEGALNVQTADLG